MDFDHMCCVKDLVCPVVLGDGLDVAIMKPVDNGGQGISVKSGEMIGSGESLLAGMLVE
jgi:hypothetical protein